MDWLKLKRERDVEWQQNFLQALYSLIIPLTQVATYEKFK